jgi:hypothetical protein
VPLFEATHPLLFLDYFRIPYRLAPAMEEIWGRDEPGPAVGRFCGRLWTVPSGGDDAVPTLLWLRADEPGDVPSGVARDGRYLLGDIPILGRVVPDSVARRWLSGVGDGWRPVQQITDPSGRPVASIWQRSDGSVFLPFDPGELIRRFWSEGYKTTGRRTIKAKARAALLRLYYTLRPALPRRLQIALRRTFTRVQGKATFPRWPIETALHDLYEWLFGQLTAFADGPVPWLDVWPDGRSWALVLTHDVETAAGQRNLGRLREVERATGHRSSWNFVPLRYLVDEELVQALADEACEIGVHGLLHDGRDLGPRRVFNKRLPMMREFARRWNAVGFRAPATQRVWERMPLLGFDYDSSYHDTAPYEPTPGGCCSYLPYFNEHMVELPITLPQDHTLFAILQHPDETVWIEKAAHVRSRRGMALVLTHPDYAHDPRVLQGYRRLLDTVGDDLSVWRALPREVSAWWRRRASSTIEVSDTGWTIQGPAAADGTIRFARPGEVALAADPDPRCPTVEQA